MARKRTQSSTPAPTQAAQEVAAADTEFPAANETEATSADAAAPADAAEVTAPDAQTATDAADPAGDAAAQAIRDAAEKAVADGRIKARPGDEPERRCFPVNWDLNYDGTVFSPEADEWPALTQAEFNALRPGGIVDGEWDDGEPADA